MQIHESGFAYQPLAVLWSSEEWRLTPTPIQAEFVLPTSEDDVRLPEGIGFRILVGDVASLR